MSLCNVLVQRRKELGITLRSLSQKTDISMTSLGFYESGERLPTVVNLNKLCEALKLDYQEVYGALLKEKETRKK